MGVLSAAILAKGAHLVAFELDKRFEKQLLERFPQRFELNMIDILKLDWAEKLAAYPPPIKLVANIPYQISSPLLYKLEEYQPHFSRVLLMLQYELAERLCAAPGRKAFGPLSLRLGLKYLSEIILKVGREYFDPPPKVDSAVVLMQPRTEKAIIRYPQLFERLINAAFAHRRNTLKNNLLAIVNKEQLCELEQQSKLDFKRRAETLDETDFIRLSELLALL